ncbi:MAG TPA: ABC transporter permease [Vicinamibacterales bacterium]|nr:ABC transporter permease [Vicinamibacterales bacterium]
MRGVSLSELFRRVIAELRYAARSLRRSPAFTVVAFLMVALGIGATTAIFAVLDAVVLRGLPYPEPDRLVSVFHPTTVPGSGESKWGLSAAGYFQFRKEATTLADLGAYRSTAFAVTGDGQDAEEVIVAQVSAPVVSALRARPHLGRWISEADDEWVAPGPLVIRPVVLGHRFWTRRYGSDPSVIGRTIQTSAGPREIIGVAERGFNLPKPGLFVSTADLAGFAVDVWEPLRLNPSAAPQNSHQYTGVARLTPGATAADAQRELATIADRFTALFPGAYSPDFIKQYNFRVGVAPLRDDILGPTVPRLIGVLFAAVGLVLLIACANVANLFLVRVESRRREAAIRGALGAGRFAIATHFISESLLLSLSAGAAGLAIAYWGTPALVASAPASIPLLGNTQLGWTSVAFAIGLSIMAGLLFAAVPLLRRSRLSEALGAGGRGLTVSKPQRMLRAGLVVGQVALAVVLVAAAGLLVRSVNALQRVEAGFDPTGVLTFRIRLPFQQYQTTEAAVAFHRQLHDEIRALPGVTAVGATSSLPLQDFGNGCAVVFRELRPYDAGEQTPCVRTERATPGFFEALGIRVRGRIPDWSDVDTRSQAVVLTEALAKRLWDNEDPIGKGINSNGPNATVGFYRVVGVIPELRATALDQPPVEAVYYAPTDLVTPGRWGAMHSLGYTVRVAAGSPIDLLPQVRAIVARLNSHVPVVQPRLMDDVVRRSTARSTFVGLLLLLAAAMALVLSAVGIYGLISYVVTQQRPEIGVRIALGAQMGQVARGVIARSMALTGAGIVMGLALAWLASRALTSLLFDVQPDDPAVLAAAVVVLLVVAVGASAGPARRAARVDPVEAFRV